MATGVVVTLGAGLLKTALDAGAFGADIAAAGKRVQVTSETVQELNFAIKTVGGSLPDVEAGFDEMTQRATEASEGVGEAVKSFRDLGVEFEDAPGKARKPIELFLDLAEAVAAETDEVKQAALAHKFFGGATESLLPLLVKGKDGVRALMQEAQSLGLVMSDVDAAIAEKFSQSLLRSKEIITGVKNTIGSALLPVLTRMLTTFNEWVAVNRDWIQQTIDQKVDQISKAFDRFLRIGKTVNEFVQTKIGGWGRIFQAVGAALAAGGIIKLIKTLNSVVRAAVALWPLLDAKVAFLVSTLNPLNIAITALLLGFALLVLAIDDVIIFLKQGDSVLGRFIDRFGDAERKIIVIEQLMASLARIGKAFNGVFTATSDLLDKAFGPALARVQPLLDALGISFDGILGPKADEILDFFEGLALLIEGWAIAFERLIPLIEQFTAVVPSGGFALPGVTFDQAQTFLGQFAPASVGATGGPTSVDRSRSVSQSVTVNVSSTDPVGAGLEVERAMERVARQAQGAFAGGEL